MEWTWSVAGRGTSVRTAERIDPDTLVITEHYSLPDGATMEDRVRMTRVKGKIGSEEKGERV